MFERNGVGNTFCISHFPEPTLRECLQTRVKSASPGVLLAEVLPLEEISIVVLATSDPKKSHANLLDNLHLTFSVIWSAYVNLFENCCSIATRY